MHQHVEVIRSTAAVFAYAKIPLLEEKRRKKITVGEMEEYVCIRLQDLARALSDVSLVPQEPGIAAVSGVDFENETFTLNRTWRDRPVFSHKETLVEIWKSGAFWETNALHITFRNWREIFAGCEKSIGAY